MQYILCIHQKNSRKRVSSVINNSTALIKVCHVTSVHPRYDPRIFHKECKSLASSGYDVTLIVNDNLPSESIDDVKILSTQEEPRNRFERMVRSKKNIKALMLEVDADIYHFHDPELLPEASWLKKKGKIVIFDSHEDVSQQILFKSWIPRCLRKPTSSLYKIYEQRKMKNIDALISVTPKVVERLKEINPNTLMITNYPIVNVESSVSKPNEKKRAICFAGGIVSDWNHENIIRAIESIEDIEYILAGKGSDEYLDKLNNLKGWDKVRFLGRISHEEVKKNVYSKAMIGMAVLTNDSQAGDEGTLGNTKIFEFMEASIPVICSNNKIWKNIVDKYALGICVDPKDTEAIHDAIIFLLDNSDKARQMGENGRRAVEVEYNWETQERVLLEAYKSLSI